MLHNWLLSKNDWVYLNEVPLEQMKMSKAAASSALISLCKHGCADFRIQGFKQYRAKQTSLPTKGRPRTKESL